MQDYTTGLEAELLRVCGQVGGGSSADNTILLCARGFDRWVLSLINIACRSTSLGL